MMTTNEFIASSVGKPWVNRATGPAAYDCWGLVIAYYNHVLGVAVPDVTDYESGGCDVDAGLYEQDEKGIWREISSPIDDCVFIVKQNGIPSHVGVIVNGRCLHAPGSGKLAGNVGYHSINAVKKMFGNITYWELAND